MKISSQNIWLNIDKPIGFSSAKVVAIVKRITGAKKVGHAGTLDPFASGVLPIALNKATKTCQYISDARKKYYFHITWGEFRDTDDVEGEVVETNNLRPTTAQIISALPFFIGKINQVPSRFSAIKINGERAYNLARKQIDFEIKSREVEIFSAKLISNSAEFGEFEIECSKGTYVRSFARDLCKKMAVCGYVSTLTRLQVANFYYKNRISLAKLKSVVNYGESFLDGSLLSLHDVLDFMVEIELGDTDALKFKNGQIITIQYPSKYPFLGSHSLDDLSLESSRANVARVVNNSQLIGLGKFAENLLSPINVF